MHFNARSLKANIDKIKVTLREYKFHIRPIAIFETWFKENNWDGNEVIHFDVTFSSYKLYCNFRNNKTGVVLPYLYANLCLEIVNLLIFAYGTYRLMNVSKVFFIELQISKNTQINVGCNIYRAPNTSISKCNENLSYILGNLTSKVVYMCGDFNIDILHCEEQTES